MNLLLDTHTVIWFLINDPKLSPTAEALIRDLENKCYISIASFWEISIKFSLGKLELVGGLTKFAEAVESSEIEFLPLSPEHIIASANLHFLHRDPFDRIIIAQSLVEKLTIVSKDDFFTKYESNVIW